MPTDHRAALAKIKRFDQLIAYLRDEMGWPIEADDFEELTFEYTPEELGIDTANAAKIQEIKRLRPLSPNQPWGIFFVKFEPRRLPVVALRRILSQVVLKKRASANKADRAAWAADDLLFVSNFGEGDARQISFAHFSQHDGKDDLPTLKVLGWDNLDTPLHLDHVAQLLTERLAWPDNDKDVASWRESWRSAFTLRHREVITTSKALAVRLAELARAIRDRIRTVLAIETERGPVTRLMKAFQEALVHDLDDGGFADMYAQTIAYGLLSARVTNPKANTADGFTTQLPVTNAFLKELMETFLHVGGRKGKVGRGPGIDFDELGVSEVVELLDDANMEAVVRDFGDKNPQEDPIIHFYELFLKEYDPQKRMQRGVFYTPRPVVSYIVRSVHKVLQTEFDLADGLADTVTWGDMAKRLTGLTIPEGAKPTDRFVTVLDPATGTGTFLVEVIEVIHRTLIEKWQREGHAAKKILDLWNDYVPKHLLPRLHGYELLMAPYAIAHLKLGLKLHETGYRFESHERARVYLTNSLEPAHDFSGRFKFAIPALAHEAEAVNAVKRTQRFTVVIGNPPYAGHSKNNAIPWAVDLVYDYKRGYPDLQKPGQAKWLQDDYVKFLRFGEWHVAGTTTGILGFITNHAWFANPTFKGMRRHLLDTFDRVSVLDLHGNANRKESATDGTPDENVFEIKQGVGISILARRALRAGDTSPAVQRSDLLGTEESKLTLLSLANSQTISKTAFRPLQPEYVLLLQDDARKAEYEEFASLPAIMDRNGDPAPGIVTTHDEFAISFSKEEQIEKIEAFLATQTEEEARGLFTLCSQSQWNYAEAKKALRAIEWKKDIVQILYRPFDVRVTVYDRHVAVHRRERVSRHLLRGGNVGLSIPRGTEIKRGWEHVFCSKYLIQHHTVSLKEVNYLFPLWLEPEWPEISRLPNINPKSAGLLSENTGLRWVDSPELSVSNTAAVSWSGRGDLRTSVGPRDVFDWMYAVLHSPNYRARYADFLKGDFARVPITPSLELFRELARRGRELAAVHLVEAPAQQALFARYDKAAKAWRYEAAPGHRPPVNLSFNGPERPVVGKVGWSDDMVWIDAVKPQKGAVDATVSDTVGFRGVAKEVWNFHIGGYQVCEKWLKDRKDRTLTADDIAHYHRIVIAAHETIRLMREIDDVIHAHGGWPGAFQGGSGASSSREASRTGGTPLGT
jgi:predicted helicase